MNHNSDKKRFNGDTMADHIVHSHIKTKCTAGIIFLKPGYIRVFRPRIERSLYCRGGFF